MTPPARLAQVQAHLASSSSSSPPSAPHRSLSSSPPSLRTPSSSTSSFPSSNAGAGASAPPGGAAKPARQAPPTASEYRFFLPMQTRWNDNDKYGHMNNVVYLEYGDSVSNAYLETHAYPPAPAPHPIGLMVSSQATYSASLGYPQPVVAALAVKHLGTRSVTWKVALFAGEYADAEGATEGEAEGEAEADRAMRGFALRDVQRGGAGRKVRLARGDQPAGGGEPRAAMFGEMVHVFVDEETRRPVEKLDEGMREALMRLVVE